MTVKAVVAEDNAADVAATATTDQTFAASYQAAKPEIRPASTAPPGASPALASTRIASAAGTAARPKGCYSAPKLRYCSGYPRSESGTSIAAIAR